MIRRQPLLVALFVGVLLVVAPSAADAYVGPGAGLSAFGALVAFIGAIFVGIFGFIWYPIKRLIRAFRKPDAEAEAEEATEVDSAAS